MTKGIVTINIGYHFIRDPAVTSNAYVNQWSYSEQVADYFIASLGGKGKVVRGQRSGKIDTHEHPVRNDRA